MGAARFEALRRGEADTGPQTAPFGLRRDHDLLGLAGNGGNALPLSNIDGLGSGSKGETKRNGCRNQAAQRHEAAKHAHPLKRQTEEGMLRN